MVVELPNKPPVEVPVVPELVPNPDDVDEPNVDPPKVFEELPNPEELNIFLSDDKLNPVPSLHKYLQKTVKSTRKRRFQRIFNL